MDIGQIAKFSNELKFSTFDHTEMPESPYLLIFICSKVKSKRFTSSKIDLDNTHLSPR